jgi:hypothetical protein
MNDSLSLCLLWCEVWINHREVILWIREDLQLEVRCYAES